ncbi:transposase [Elusimicrobiota bacterium]
MPRGPRPKCPDIWLHLISRGNNGLVLFRDPEDFESMENYLPQAARRGQFEIHSYCLMSTHIHLLVHTLGEALSGGMGWLLGCYARRYNGKYSRSGHVFERRFRSEVVADEAYLLEVGRYIHMNPVRAGVVARPEEYRWSSLRVYLGSDQRSLVSRSMLRQCFADTASRQTFYEHTISRMDVREGDGGWPADPPWYAGPDPETALSGGRGKASSCGSGTLPAEITMKEVLEALGCGVESIVAAQQGSRRGRERGILALALAARSGLAAREIAGMLGLGSVQAAYNLLSRVRRQLRTDRDLRALAEKLGCMSAGEKLES